ncbi:MAG: coproporphyrinogen III oxidase, partial [Bacteroidia bacterium]|nr:coproporphyrinogen III oxidase [Bacteroidia bacterium]
KKPYIGLGPAAHSYNGKTRSWNYPSVIRYCKGEDISGGEELSGRDIFNESIMLGLRTVAGVDLSTLDRDLLKEAMPQILKEQRGGNLIYNGNNIKIPSDKLFVSDGIIRDLFL